MLPINVAVFAPTESVRRQLTEAFAALGWKASEYAADDQSRAALANHEMIFVECAAGGSDAGIRVARSIRARSRDTQIVIVAAESSEELAIEAVHLGAADYLKPPFSCEQVAGISRRRDMVSKHEMAMVGESPEMLKIKRFIPRAAVSDSNVLIVGETGTGKEMVATELHQRSRRSSKPFICVNCAAFPDSLIESELFGHEKGAFTGAISARDGKLVQANGGTLFFDEIGDMSLLAQAKILRAIETKEVCRLGGDRSIRVDVRIIAATNRDLEALMREDRFRADLYFRLNVARIELPPLRERNSDIPLLIEHLLPHYNRVFGSRVIGFRDEALDHMLNYSWPGNVRELKNVMEIVFLNLDPRQTTVWHLPDQVTRMWRKLGELPPDEREQLLSVLFSTRWNVSEAARRMHWSRMTMYRKLARHNISPERGAAPKTRAAGE